MVKFGAKMSAYAPRLDGMDTATIPIGAGTVTVAFDVNLFELNDDDQRFVFGLVDMIRSRNAVSTSPDARMEES